MKQASLKALGVAAAGAALAIAGAGTASAGTLQNLTTTATGAAKGLPLEETASLAPGGPVLQAGARAMKSGMLEQAAGAADMALGPHLPLEKLASSPTRKLTGAPTDNKGNAGLLGGLPTKAIAPNGLSIPNLGMNNSVQH
ncbi:hypothetical protein GCM10010218_32760 [Streptomyces mashuensis]|uniref:ATP-binding protein n=1 Tax=Streptomyces mashuensis TaxID=33904 RepID=A0A919EDE4_9ACTN|nr:hypothetical protein [Streptomyces mashuensis]GHF48722.1 hypothetical protein GCM10010218_32760 [Streptomyces mashuensis]